MKQRTNVAQELDKSVHYHAKGWIKHDKTRFCGQHFPTSTAEGNTCRDDSLL